jgi:hypothetical protein
MSDPNHGFKSGLIPSLTRKDTAPIAWVPFNATKVSGSKLSFK